MKRRAVIDKIKAGARLRSVPWTLTREGARHTVYSLDGLMIPVPRHSEIADQMAHVIWRQCEPKPGRGGGDEPPRGAGSPG